ncbi:hypothetical protein C451_13306 [Halococcus thailandensis JCM 13552]|uniref:Uncharacterized protein n=1 Tax=Halococcus thailandensis JCM 13552 TaxID=1227457 RepID=M0N4W1_9EURY|nr:hypothetical protein C451_13306 [Halococcus thailandensis JCM 13552]
MGYDAPCASPDGSDGDADPEGSREKYGYEAESSWIVAGNEIESEPESHRELQSEDGHHWH